MTTIASRYRVLRELGRGGMGVVYLVEHLHTGEQHALKVLLGHSGASADVLERFRREARAPARIRSEGVVKITDFDVAPELGGAPFLVMELLHGQDLDKMLEAHGRLSPEWVVWLFGEAAKVLDRAHAAGVVHRDLKPENLFLHRRQDGVEVLKVVDFGISRISGEGLGDMTAAALTKSGAMMGTPLYMSPEQARGLIQKIGPATDMWSLGLIAHRLLTGEVYWTATTLAELMVQIIAEPMAIPSERWPYLPASFDAWLLRACDRDPARRFSSVAEQARELAMALGVVSPSIPVETGWGSLVDASPAHSGSSPAEVTVVPTLAQSTASIAHTVAPAPTRRRGWWALVGLGTVVVGTLVTVTATRSTQESAPAAAGASDDEGSTPTKPKKPASKTVMPLEAVESAEQTTPQPPIAAPKPSIATKPTPKPAPSASVPPPPPQASMAPVPKPAPDPTTAKTFDPTAP